MKIFFVFYFFRFLVKFSIIKSFNLGFTEGLNARVLLASKITNALIASCVGILGFIFWFDKEKFFLSK